MPPLKLNDDELDAIMAAARPLALNVRDAFLQEVATTLAGYQELGPGIVHRVCATVQRRHFDAPDLGHGDNSKYR
jgi:hypothetical protein